MNLEDDASGPKASAVGFLPVGLGAGVAVVAFGTAHMIYRAGQYAHDSWLGRIVEHWPNFLSIIAFGMAVGLLIARLVNLTREQSAFSLNLLGNDADTLILPEDALSFRKQLRQLNSNHRGLVLLRLLDAGLQRARANWSAEDVGTAVKTEGDLIAGRMEADYSLIRYLAWAIPSIGFVGTVLGIGKAMGNFGGEAGSASISAASQDLGMAFDTTLIALILSLILMYLLHRVQARDDAFLVAATSWCMRRFVYRMHIPAMERTP